MQIRSAITEIASVCPKNDDFSDHNSKDVFIFQLNWWWSIPVSTAFLSRVMKAKETSHWLEQVHIESDQ